MILSQINAIALLGIGEFGSGGWIQIYSLSDIYSYMLDINLDNAVFNPNSIRFAIIGFDCSHDFTHW